jgi:SIR2-like domain
MTERTKLGKHHLRIKARDRPMGAAPDAAEHAEEVRSWLTALVGAEHLSLLVGSGLGIGVATSLGAKGLDMNQVDLAGDEAAQVDANAEKLAKASKRGEVNIEDQLRSALALLAGLEVLEPEGARTIAWRGQLAEILGDFAKRGLGAEQAIRQKITTDGTAQAVERALVGFLLGFASRPPSRERLNVFTTNYDRLIEFGCDRGGLRVLDRFVGSVEPVFRASRLDVDLHYNPPGIRGEPRYLEGVLRLCKLHGSLDWRMDAGRLRRMPLEFGGSDPELESAGDGGGALERLIIYPNAAKDVETLLFPYAELFRDFSAALCRPNNVLVTFGYGFGDDHVNRVIQDMLTLRSTHLLVISYSDPGKRIENFLSQIAPEQFSVLLGSHFGDLNTLVDNYLPQAGAEPLLLRQARRNREIDGGEANSTTELSSAGAATSSEEDLEPDSITEEGSDEETPKEPADPS